MTNFATDHASALADVAAAGQAVVFTRSSAGTYDPTTDTHSAPGATTIPGKGMFVTPDPQQYATEELILSVHPCLLFVPSAYPLKAWTSAFVLPGDVTTLNDVTFVVKKILKVVAPNGNAILAHLALATA